MQFEYYSFDASPSFHDFEFTSTGTKGAIKKVARFTKLEGDVYNFAFGDLDEHTGAISDTVVSNNGDPQKIFFTLGRIILDFTILYPESRIFIQGSTNTRTRLYQININKYRPEIDPLFEVMGYLTDEWEFFRPAGHYQAFLFWRHETPLLF